VRDHIAAQGGGARACGKVEINHAVVRDLATRVDPAHDRVFVGGTQALPVEGHLYLVLNKPKDSITTLSDERGRTTVMSMVRTRERVYPWGGSTGTRPAFFS